KARHADQQRMTAGQQGDQRPFHDRLLAEDDGAHPVAYPRDVLQRPLGLGDHLAFVARPFVDRDAHAVTLTSFCLPRRLTDGVFARANRAVAASVTELSFPSRLTSRTTVTIS